MVSRIRHLNVSSEKIISSVAVIQELITCIRQFRANHNLPSKQVLQVFIKTNQPEIFYQYGCLVKKIACVEKIQIIESPLANVRSIVLQTHEIFIPIQESDENKQLVNEKIKAEINHLETFLNSIESKLSNEKFLANAKPNIIEREQQKKQDTLDKLAALRKSIA